MLKKMHYYWKILEAMYASPHSLSNIQSLESMFVLIGILEIIYAVLIYHCYCFYFTKAIAIN